MYGYMGLKYNLFNINSILRDNNKKDSLWWTNENIKNYECGIFEKCINGITLTTTIFKKHWNNIKSKKKITPTLKKLINKKRKNKECIEEIEGLKLDDDIIDEEWDDVILKEGIMDEIDNDEEVESILDLNSDDIESEHDWD